MLSPAAAISVTRVAAFDVDGTILRGQSQVYFAKMLVRRRIAGAGLMARVLWWYALMRLGVPFDQAKAQRTVIGLLAGAPQAWIDEVLATFVSEALAPNLRRARSPRSTACGPQAAASCWSRPPRRRSSRGWPSILGSTAMSPPRSPRRWTGGSPASWSGPA